VDDLRESPAVKLARHLQERGGEVVAYEPFKLDAGLPGIHQVGSLDASLTDADVILLAVAHDQFRDLDPQAVRGKTDADVVFDAVRAWDKTPWEQAGFQFYGLARKY